MTCPASAMLSSLAGVTFLILLKASPKIAASSSCTRTVIRAATVVDKDAIYIIFYKRMVSKGDWTLEARVELNHTYSTYANGYAIQMLPSSDTMPKFCDSYATTENTFYVFRNLTWGITYSLRIAEAKFKDRSTSISYFERKTSALSPDCFEETGDREYCRYAASAKFTKVGDVRVDCIVRDDTDPALLVAYISWLPPVQVNGELIQAEIKYRKAKHTEEYHKLDFDIHLREITEPRVPLDARRIESTLKEIFTNGLTAAYIDELRGGQSLRYVSEVGQLEEGEDYTMEVKMYMKPTNNESGYHPVANQPLQFHFNTSNLSSDFLAYLHHNTPVYACYTAPPTLPPYNFSTVTPQQVIAPSSLLPEEGTIVVLVLLSVLAVLSIVALILCYIRKRPITHIPKRGIFGRFPSDASGLHKSSETEALRQKGDPDGSRGDVWQTVQSSLGVNIFYEPHTPPSLSENDPIFMTKEFNRSFLRIEDKLGSGQFGVVYKGFALGIDGTDKYQPVAVKSLKEDANDAMKVDFLSEIKLIIEIGSHPNMLPILGCCTTEEPFYLITEFMKYGDLLRFLLRCREEIYQEQDGAYKVTKRGQLQIARQIARGMEYLSSTRYYHGDLAARNVLVGEGLVVKISDFGMADDIYQQGYKRLAPSQKRPVKWVSLETNTRGHCTIQSDVWSFGIVLYEIYTFGDVPYPGLDGRDVVRALMEGFRMDKPENCSNEIYEIMLQCWHENPYDRPSFTELYTRLDDMLSQTSDDYICDLEINVRYHPDRSQTFRPSSSPIPIRTLSHHGSHGPNRCHEHGEFEIDECTC